MHFLLLCILSSTGIFIIFKSLDRFKIPSFPVIVINYLLATIMGFAINPGTAKLSEIRKMDWLPASILIGLLFILMFFLVAYSSQKAGISVTTVASKMSVIFPILFSMLIDKSDHFTFLKGAAIVCTLCGVALTVYRTPERTKIGASVYIPLILFAGMGIVDSLVKYAQHRFVGDSDTAIFSAVLFLNAFLAGILVLLFSPKYYRSFKQPTVWGWGILLGAVNFGSIFFIVRALNYQSAEGRMIDSSVIFGVNNTSIVALSVLVGFLVFGERLKAINWVGICLSALALILILSEMMNDAYHTIASEAEGMFRDRGSRFIAFAYPLVSELEIKEKMTMLRKEYHDARHHCFAWRLGPDMERYRFNDDGEPSGSAGRPIYGQIQSRELTDILIVVIRYFGGTLLGVGGLINAYKTASSNALDQAKIIEKRVEKQIKLKFSYDELNTVMSIAKEYDLKQEQQLFDLKCSLTLRVWIRQIPSVTERFGKVKGCSMIIEE